MRIGINALFWEPRSGGMGRYARELLSALAASPLSPHLTVFHGLELPADVRDTQWAQGVEWVELPVTVTHGPPHNALRSLAAQWGAMAWQAERRRLHVLHGLANVAPPLTARVATVVTLHDLIWMRFGRSMSRRDTLAMKLIALPSAQHATRVIAISEAVKRDLETTLGLDGSRIDVVGHGVSTVGSPAPVEEAALRRRLGLGQHRVVLCVAQKREHKNLTTLVRALAALPERDVVLVIPGGPTDYEREIRRVADEEGFADRLILPDWVSEAELEGLYRAATVFALPSLEEGFGLPVLEAMARGLPVACSNTSSLPEVAGNAAELFDPRDPAAVGHALATLLRDPERREELVRRGRERVERFTWERTAHATLETYARAAAERRSRA